MLVDRVFSAACSTLVAVLLCTPSTALSTELRVLDLEPLESLQANGHLHLPVKASSRATLSVDMSGLAPYATYVLCLDAETAETPASAGLGKLVLAGWPPGNFWETHGIKKGFWDFARVETDAEGRFAQAFELPLPPLDYRVRLLVKRVEATGGMVSVLQAPVLLLEVQSPLREKAWLLALVAALTCPIPLLWLLHLMRRRTGTVLDTFALVDTDDEEDAPALAGSAAAAPAAATNGAAAEAVRAPLVETEHADPPRDRVEQARIAGTLAHHRNFSWVEIHGRRKGFRPRQALVFRILIEHDPDCEGMLQDEIVKAWEKVYGVARANPVRVCDIFRAYKDEPGDFIVRVPGPASAYRLRLEPAAAPRRAEDTPHSKAEPAEAEPAGA